MDGKERTCPDRVDRIDLTKRAAEHLKHIYAEVRGDKEGCDETTGRGPKCDINFNARRDKGATGLICGDCGSAVEIMPKGLMLDDGAEVCPECNEGVNEMRNQVIACTQQQCRSKGKVTCRQCCVQSFQEQHYYQHAYQPKGSSCMEWLGCTVEQWPDRKKGASSRRPKNTVLMTPIGGQAPKASNTSADGNAKASTANNVLATRGSAGENTSRVTQYLGTLDGRHARAADVEYDPKWEPPGRIKAQYGRKRKILGECTGMVKAMAQEHKNLSRYGGDESEYTLNGVDIHLKMRVRCNTSTQYAVNMCWLCMSIKRGNVKWNAENFPAEHEDMEMMDEESEQMVDVVSKDDHMYQFNGKHVCDASGHTCLGFNSTLESFRSQRDWLTAARKDPDFNKGLPSKMDKSKKLHSAEAHKVFMEFTLNLFPAVASPMAYPEGGMPAYIKEWYESHWKRSLSDEELFVEGVKLMRWFAKPFAETQFTKTGAKEGAEARKLLDGRRLQRDARKTHQPMEKVMTQTVTMRRDAELPAHGSGGQRVMEFRVGARGRTVLLRRRPQKNDTRM